LYNTEKQYLGTNSLGCKQEMNLISTLSALNFHLCNRLWSSKFVFRNGRRGDTYSPQDYSDEFGSLVQAIGGNQNIPVKNNLVGPSAASITWGPDDVWKTGFIENYEDDLFALSVEQYVIQSSVQDRAT